MTALGIKRKAGESWQECALRYGRKYGLETEIKQAYDEGISAGDDPNTAAWAACYEWDVCELLVDDNEETKTASE